MDTMRLPEECARGGFMGKLVETTNMQQLRAFTLQFVCSYDCMM